MICGLCLARLSSCSRPGVRLAIRNASSATSRLDELIIHDTPRSTRKPKRVVRKRPADVQAKLFDLYRERLAVSGDDSSRTTNARTADVTEVTQELDKRGKEYLDRELDAKQYDSLKAKLSDAFLGHQLRSYCRSKGVDGPVNATKSQLVGLILGKLWNVTRLDVTTLVSSPTDGLLLAIGPVGFALLTRNPRSPLHDKAGQILRKIEVDRQNQTLRLKMSKRERDFMEQAITSFTDSIRTMTETFPISFDEKFMTSIEKSTGTVIEQHEDGKIQVSYLLGSRHVADEALTLLHSCAAMMRSCTDVRTLVQAGETYEAPCLPVRPRPCEADIAWVRTTTSSVGATLPPYVVADNDFRPTFERSVNHVAKTSILRPDDLFRSADDSTQTLRDIIADKVRIDNDDAATTTTTTIITFGHALSLSSRRDGEGSMTTTTWCSDIPRLFSVVSSLSPVEETTSYNLVYASVPVDGRPEETLTIEVRGKFETGTRLDLVFNRTRLLESTVLRLPSHRADIKHDRRSSQTLLSSKEERDVREELKVAGLTATSNDTRLPVMLELSSSSSSSSSSSDEKQRFRLVGTESIKRTTTTTKSGRLNWTVRRGSPCLGSGQELSLVVPAASQAKNEGGEEEICKEIGRWLSLL